jgi:hypothetical protein
VNSQFSARSTFGFALAALTPCQFGFTGGRGRLSSRRIQDFSFSAFQLFSFSAFQLFSFSAARLFLSFLSLFPTSSNLPCFPSVPWFPLQ